MDSSIFGQQAWEERYRSESQIWSGAANAVLVDQANELLPGTALDAGAGEGGDACWLAARGWTVTGADISTTALERAAARAEAAGLVIDWQHIDLATEPARGTYDLVTAHYLHMPRAARGQLFRHLADAVAPGGTLLIVGHDLHDAAHLHAHVEEMGWGVEEVVASLGAGWTVELADVLPRQGRPPGGGEITTVHDTVVRARREAQLLRG